MNMTLFTSLGLGFLLGLKHAFEADHIAAISTVSKNNSISSSTGMLWGFGHTISLLIVGLVVLIFKIRIPEHLALWFEFIVGVMLIILGLNVLITISKSKIHFHKHKHGNKGHAHFHSHLITKKHVHANQPFFVGLIHGLAGSAALTLLVLTTINSLFTGLIYILVFGIGSIVGMVLISYAISLPFALISNKFQKTHKIMRLSTSLICFGMGFGIIYQTIMIF